MKLIRSPIKGKKWRAIFKDGKHGDFGDATAEDFTMHKDEARRKNYKSRHAKDLQTGDPRRAGYLSYYILWNKPTIWGSLIDFKRRFGDL